MPEVKKFQDLKIGDVIEHPTKGSTTVIATHPIHVPQKMYLLEVDTGDSVKVSGNHLFYSETNLDRQSVSARKRRGKKLFGSMDSVTEKALANLSVSTDVVKTTLYDFAHIFESVNDSKRFAEIVRIADSVGWIEEENTFVRDIADPPDVLPEAQGRLRWYDARLMAQQLLSLSGKSKWRKKYPLVVGKVRTAEEIAALLETQNVFLPDPKK